MTATVGVGLIGLGTVGSSVARHLLTTWELLGERAGAIPVLRRVAVRDPLRVRDIELARVPLDADAEALVDDPEVALVVEVMGGVDRASTLIERALRAGKPVVTANKAAMAAHGLELAAVARGAGVSLRYEAAAGGAVPIVGLLRDSLGGDRINSLEMIINGTSNLILSLMAREAMSYAAALAQAQAAGYAEADPCADVDGHDAAAKLVLLGRLAFDAALGTGDVSVIGISGVDATDTTCAASMGAAIRLVASAELRDGGLALTVRPTAVDAGHPLYAVDGIENAVVIDSDAAGRLVLRGRGAGGEATASAVLSDIVQSVRTPGATPPLPSRVLPMVDPATVERGAYVRVRLAAVPEADRLVAQALEDRGLAILASTVIEGDEGMPVQLALLTSAVPRAVVDNAIETLDSLAAVDGVAAVMDSLGARS